MLSGAVSGTWTTNGSPYILITDCTVASNQTVTIEPGVTAIFGPEVTFRIHGGVTAIGTLDQPIVFRGASSTNYWREIQIAASGPTNRFINCRISDAFWGLNFVVGGNQIMTADVLNCDFVNCRDAGVVCQAWGGNGGDATLLVKIQNCVFDATGNGCVFTAGYSDSVTPGHGYADAQVTGNIFRNLNQAAMDLRQNTSRSTNASRPIFINNTISRVGRGVSWVTADFFEPVIRNNIFFGCSNGVYRFGGGSGGIDASFNCFFGGTTDFVGYPPSYGFPIINNHRGDPCDVYFNIFLDPQFIDTNVFLLSKFSPCIDAGDPNVSDACFQFSHGSAISDIGAYGGPEACGWLTHGFAPVITGPPSDQASCVGGSATFKVRVQGSEPLSYRWYFNGTNLVDDETNAQFSLVNLETNQAGTYSVVVSNAFGSMTSAPARLLVFDACVGIHLYAGLSITGVVGRTYAIESATNLGATTWTLVGTNTFTTPRWLYIDTNTPFNPWKFFRVRLYP